MKTIYPYPGSEAFRTRLQLLDLDHRNARTPWKRHEIEQKMREIRALLAEVEEEEAMRAKVIDLDFERWRRGR